MTMDENSTGNIYFHLDWLVASQLTTDEYNNVEDILKIPLKNSWQDGYNDYNLKDDPDKVFLDYAQYGKAFRQDKLDDILLKLAPHVPQEMLTYVGNSIVLAILNNYIKGYRHKIAEYKEQFKLEIYRPTGTKTLFSEN